MSRRWFLGPILVTLVLAIGIPLLADAEPPNRPLITPLGKLPDFDRTIRDHAQAALQEGRDTFRFDTFGDESFWGDTLQLHQTIVGARQGGVGPGLSPAAALGLGLKVDVDALPRKLQAELQAKKMPLDDPAVTLQFLRLNAVVGVKGFFADGGRIERIGITCALCHSQVDDSVTPGIGHRLDGWANRDLNVGAIIAFAPNLQPFVDLLSVVIPGITQDTVRTG